MRKPRILVTGASGRNASAAVLDLLKRGFPVRALVRRQDQRSEALRSAGAEIFVGDLFDYRDLERALVDVQRAYHSAPYAPNLLHGMMLFAIAAEQAKLEDRPLLAHENLAWRAHAQTQRLYLLDESEAPRGSVDSGELEAQGALHPIS